MGNFVFGLLLLLLLLISKVQSLLYGYSVDYNRKIVNFIKVNESKSGSFLEAEIFSEFPISSCYPGNSRDAALDKKAKILYFIGYESSSGGVFLFGIEVEKSQSIASKVSLPITAKEFHQNSQKFSVIVKEDYIYITGNVFYEDEIGKVVLFEIEKKSMKLKRLAENLEILVSSSGTSETVSYENGFYFSFVDTDLEQMKMIGINQTSVILDLPYEKCLIFSSWTYDEFSKNFIGITVRYQDDGDADPHMYLASFNPKEKKFSKIMKLDTKYINSVFIAFDSINRVIFTVLRTVDLNVMDFVSIDAFNLNIISSKSCYAQNNNKNYLKNNNICPLVARFA